ncbi:hypothetical protein OIU84_018024 [Salix udensis]|uniref:J domain-containing protein n=1 Tax=Salix udensis TaxID=889485 RepID=A0AAD6PL62_9ROSI|nr:hypothetical protein OIU84_018024 [Salix udensis]
MLEAGAEIDPNMVSAILGVFGVDTSLGLGQQIHSLVIKRSFGSNPFVGNGLINMYSKCGDLEDSIKVFSRMPCMNSVSWNSMIAAFAHPEMGKYAAEQLILSAPEKPSPYILLANIYSSKGRWKERAKTIKRMKEMCVAKETGISWIEIENNLHSFAVEDKMHPQAEIIYGVLAGLYWHMIDEGRAEEDSPLSTSSAYTVLGIEPGCSSAAIKAAFRAKVKQFHPDLNKDGKVSDLMIRRIIQAYEMLSNLSRSEIIERECLDPFEDPECEAFDIFVNEVLCVGKGIDSRYAMFCLK